MNKVLLGALAGFVATGPMTLAMKLMHEQLPAPERYPLPPREITMEIAEEAGIKEHMDETERWSATVAGHFAYGAAMGALYAPLAERLPGHPALKGIGWGLAVWTGSYLGWLPAFGILSPATEHPPRRNALMIAAHVVWGAGIGFVTNTLDEHLRDGQDGRKAARRAS